MKNQTLKSSPRLSVIDSPEAQVDYDDSLLYGLLNWSFEQTEKYKTGLDHAIENPCHFPDLANAETSSVPVAGLYRSNSTSSIIESKQTPIRSFGLSRDDLTPLAT
jgi:hypothetical protein